MLCLAPQERQSMSVFNGLLLKPVNKQAALGMSGKKHKRVVRHASQLPCRVVRVLSLEEIVETWKYLPPQTPKRKKKQKGYWFFRKRKKKWKLTPVTPLCVDTLKEVVVQPSGTLFELAGRFNNGQQHPLQKLPMFSSRSDCRQFLKYFVVRRKAECAAVLLSKQLGVKVAKSISGIVTDNDLALYYPAELQHGTVPVHLQDKTLEQNRLQVPQHRSDDQPRHAVSFQRTNSVAFQQCSNDHKQGAGRSGGGMKRRILIPEELIKAHSEEIINAYRLARKRRKKRMAKLRNQFVGSVIDGSIGSLSMSAPQSYNEQREIKPVASRVSSFSGKLEDRRNELYPD